MKYKEAQRSLKEDIWKMQSNAANLSKKIKDFENGNFYEFNVVVEYSEKDYSPATIERVFKEQVGKALQEHQKDKHRLAQCYEWISFDKGTIRFNRFLKYTGIILVLKLFGCDWISAD